MVRSLRFLFLVLAAAALTFAPGMVFSQTMPTPVSIQPLSGSASGLQTMVTFDARNTPGAANAGYYSRPVLVQPSTLGGLAQGLIRRATPLLALTLAIEAAGWAIDELSGQVIIPGQPQAPLVGQVWCFDSSTGGGTVISCATTAAAAASRHNVPDAIYLGTVTQRPYGYDAHFRYGEPWNYEFQLPVYRHSTAPAGAVNANPGSAPQPVPMADLGALVAQNPALWNAALHNADGSVNRNPDVMAEAARLAQGIGSPSPTNPAPDPTGEWNSGNQGGAPSSVKLEFPIFCEWATKVCDLADWMRLDSEQEVPDAEMPIEEPSISVSWSSGFSGGSCPAPSVVDVLGADVEFSYGPLCDLAVYIKPIVLAGAALMAVFIVGGFRRAS